MTRGPNKYMTKHSVGLRLRRLRADSPARRQAKQLFKDGKVYEAVQAMVDNGDLTEAHKHAFTRWAMENNVPVGGSVPDAGAVEDLV